MNVSKKIRIGVCCPAGPVSRAQILPALTILQNAGYEVVPGDALYRQDGYLAGSVEARWADFEKFWADARVNIIWAARGGFGSAQLLPFLKTLKPPQNRKLLVGFSDITALQCGLYQILGVPSLSGFTLTSQTHVGNPHLDLLDQYLRWELNELYFPESDATGDNEASEGILLGGTLSVLVSLAGTPFLPTTENIILFLEDINEPLYKIERYLLQLQQAGFLNRVRAVLSGAFLYENKTLDVQYLFRKYLPVNIPVLSGLPYGHFPNSIALPIGVWAKLEPAHKRLSWLWPDSSFLD